MITNQRPVEEQQDSERRYRKYKTVHYKDNLERVIDENIRLTRERRTKLSK